MSDSSEETPAPPAEETPVPAAPPQPQENPLVNIMLNVLVPVIVLNFLSKEDRLGPFWALVVAVSLPLGYGIWFGVTRKKANFFSILGLVSILLTGILGLYRTEAIWFAFKEALVPAIFGAAILGSHWTKKPLLNVFLLSPELFDLKRIRKRVAANDQETAYRKIEFHGTLMLAGSMFVSSVANYFLAMHFLIGKESDLVEYNKAIARLTGWGFAVIGVPMLVVMVLTLLMILKRIGKLTGLEQDDFFLPK